MNKNFEDIPTSTNTIIVVCNFNVDMESAYEITPCVIIPITPSQTEKLKKRTQKKHIDLTKYNDGDIIGKSFGSKYCGVSSPKKNFFRNAVSIITKIDGKKINFKISSSKVYNKVKFQITGCKSMIHAVKAIQNWYNIVKDYNIVKSNFDQLILIFTTVMVNINIDLGFNVNREKFDQYINNNTEYMSLLETSFGYTGLNIKVPITPTHLTNIESTKVCLNLNTNQWTINNVSYNNFLDIMEVKDRNKWIQKKRYGSFLVFYSGKVIFSSFNHSLMKVDYNKFMKIIQECKSEIEI